ncbi:hypothetical protein OG21DRAFT_1528285, partial [Imleria badia]
MQLVCELYVAPGQMHTQPASSNGLKRKHMETLPASTKQVPKHYTCTWPDAHHACELEAQESLFQHPRCESTEEAGTWTEAFTIPYGQTAKVNSLVPSWKIFVSNGSVMGKDNDCTKQSKTSGAITNTEGAMVNTEVAVVNSDGKKYVKAKASDYDRGTQSVIETAIEFYCAILLCNDPYAQPVKEMDWARVAWDKAHLHHQ